MSQDPTDFAPHELTPTDIPKLDLSEFNSVEKAIKLAQGDFPRRYTEIIKSLPEQDPRTTKHHLLFMFFLSRFRGSHDAILRELIAENPHAVIPLLRVYFETLTRLIYATDDESQVLAMTGTLDPSTGKIPRLLPFKEVFEKLSSLTISLMPIYNDLSRITHPNEDAVMSVFDPVLNADGTTTSFGWQIIPHWRESTDFYGACAAIKEMSETADTYLILYAQLYLN